jgi:hypothetical protein
MERQENMRKRMRALDGPSFRIGVCEEKRSKKYEKEGGWPEPAFL